MDVAILIAFVTLLLTLIGGIFGGARYLSAIKEQNSKQTIEIADVKMETKKIWNALDTHKRWDEEYQREGYKDKIIEFYGKLKHAENGKVYPEEMYKKTFDYYGIYKQLKGNTYVDEVLVYIKQCYERDYGVKK